MTSAVKKNQRGRNLLSSSNLSVGKSIPNELSISYLEDQSIILPQQNKRIAYPMMSSNQVTSSYPINIQESMFLSDQMESMMVQENSQSQQIEQTKSSQVYMSILPSESNSSLFSSIDITLSDNQQKRINQTKSDNKILTNRINFDSLYSIPSDISLPSCLKLSPKKIQTDSMMLEKQPSNDSIPIGHINFDSLYSVPSDISLPSSYKLSSKKVQKDSRMLGIQQFSDKDSSIRISVTPPPSSKLFSSIDITISDNQRKQKNIFDSLTSTQMNAVNLDSSILLPHLNPSLSSLNLSDNLCPISNADSVPHLNPSLSSLNLSDNLCPISNAGSVPCMSSIPNLNSIPSVNTSCPIHFSLSSNPSCAFQFPSCISKGSLCPFNSSDILLSSLRPIQKSSSSFPFKLDTSNFPITSSFNLPNESKCSSIPISILSLPTQKSIKKPKLEKQVEIYNQTIQSLQPSEMGNTKPLKPLNMSTELLTQAHLLANAINVLDSKNETTKSKFRNPFPLYGASILMIETIVPHSNPMSLSHIKQLTIELKTIFQQHSYIDDEIQTRLLYLLKLLNKCLELQASLKQIMNSHKEKLIESVHNYYKKETQTIINKVMTFIKKIFPFLNTEIQQQSDDKLATQIVKYVHKNYIKLEDLYSFVKMIIRQSNKKL